ncbi:3-oxoacyl-[acyl-carrier-protein] synthase [Clavispora lusitaniae]|nr:3-oxoacyl-[acyl-carrier-protein] synthase [Clavispora lusitaniae]
MRCSKDRYSDRPVQNDILQESFINTMSAWVNMLLLSFRPTGDPALPLSSPPDTGIETILSGKYAVVGGYDDLLKRSTARVR